MTLVMFPDRVRYDFATQLLAAETPAGEGHGTKFFPSHRSIEIAHPIVGQLLRRIADGRPVVMPYGTVLKDGRRPWLIAAATRRDLDRTLAQLGRFLVPTYVEFTHGGTQARIQAFDSRGVPLQRLGAQLYPGGYYSLRSPERFYEVILQRLALWMDLEQRQPILQYDRRPTYRSLLDIFDAALAARNWSEAETALSELRRHGLTSGDNLTFLELQLLAQQEQWSTIWARSDYAEIARLRMPSSARAALLTAFHHSVLLPLEQEQRWADALDAYRQSRDRLGRLLIGRFGLTQAPVARVFGYQCALENNRAELASLRELDSEPGGAALYEHLDEVIAQALATARPEGATALSLPADLPALPDALRTARLALLDADYDTVVSIANELEDSAQRAVLLIEVAALSGDVAVTETAALTYWELPVERQTALLSANPSLQPKLRIIDAILNVETAEQSHPPATQLETQTWPEWFERALASSGASDLQESLDRLVAGMSENFWAPENVRRLNAQLTEAVILPDALNGSMISGALQKLTELTLRDTAFPRDDSTCAELYELLYTALLVRDSINESHSMQLLRLAEALLRRSPQRLPGVYVQLHEWFSHPVPALEERILDAFDLMGEYGLQGAQLIELYRMWALHLLSLPTNRDRVCLQSWLAFAGWIQPGPDVLLKLRERLAQLEEQETDDPLMLLPSGYRIGIFTLRPSSAERAKQMLLARNRELDIRICVEQDLNGPAKAMAENSNLVVVVSTCISHALTYGIEPYMQGRQPVFPASSGSTSMLRAIEARIRTDTALTGKSTTV